MSELDLFSFATSCGCSLGEGEEDNSFSSADGLNWRTSPGRRKDVVPAPCDGLAESMATWQLPSAVITLVESTSVWCARRVWQWHLG